MSLEIREKAEREIMRLKAKTGLPLSALLGFAGIPERTWRKWQERSGLETGHNSNIPRGYYLTPAETEAIVNYCRVKCAPHPEKGYRRLCWEMVDKNISRVGESSVYKVINRHKLAKNWDELAVCCALRKSFLRRLILYGSLSIVGSVRIPHCEKNLKNRRLGDFLSCKLRKHA
ncbi:MAG: hypothetical protein LBB48_10400 [Treponema sp.]|jgi:hypothetical protein|nr:hypothetical protein [Treponema sp.]